MCVSDPDVEHVYFPSSHVTAPVTDSLRCVSLVNGHQHCAGGHALELCTDPQKVWCFFFFDFSEDSPKVRRRFLRSKIGPKFQEQEQKRKQGQTHFKNKVVTNPKVQTSPKIVEKVAWSRAYGVQSYCAHWQFSEGD